MKRGGGEVIGEVDADQVAGSGGGGGAGGKGGVSGGDAGVKDAGGKDLAVGGASGQGGSIGVDASVEDTRPPPVDQALPAVDAPRDVSLPVDRAVDLPVDKPLPPDMALEQGILTVSYALNTSTTPIDLTAEGTIDWTHFGQGTVSTVTRKKGVPAQIMMTMAGGTAERYTDRPPRWAWSDGTPTMTGISVPDGVFVPGDGAKFTITVPAGKTMRTLKLYCGAFEARGQLDARLSDGSAMPKTDTSLNSAGVGKDAIYTIAFAAASEGQKLTVTWVVTNPVNSECNVTMSAATLH